ncbi:MAG: zinc-dependent metalloprotease [Bacteroidales bacterium]|nr:zinc-dependent metalloprotease [Bacteroidales bacterium]
MKAHLTTILSALCIAAVLCLSATPSSAQRKKKDDKKTPVAQAPKDGPSQSPKKKGPESLEKFVKKEAKVMKGFTTVYNQEDKWYISINDSIIGRDIVLVSRISKSAEGARRLSDGYAGDIISHAMVRFSKGPGNKIFLQQLREEERASGEMARNVEKSNTAAIVASFDIVAQNANKTENLIDVTNFLLTENSLLHFDRSMKRSFTLQNMMKDRSYVKEINTYPINTEFKTMITYGKENGQSATFEYNASMVLLPKEPMKGRIMDPRVGYFAERFTDFDMNPQGVKKVSLVARWRLEPKADDLQKYLSGELVEPQKPIVIYIDPTTPKEWVPYLIAGVNDWQAAFEQAGFKNAIVGKVAPTKGEDPTWSLEDATHSAIVYKPSNISNARGGHVSDPRSGEIIETHIDWYHNVMDLLRKWYFIQCAPSDPMARAMELPEELMGQLIRFVSSHEVGHALGLMHNFGGSNCPIYTIDNLKNVEFLKKYGHSSSIMDYARFLYVAEEKDNIPQELLLPCIGPYDKWAIEWGYKYYPQFKTAEEESDFLKKMVTEKLKDPTGIYRYGDELDFSDPRYQSEDLGVSQMESNEVGIRNLKVVMDNIEKWTATPNEPYTNLGEIYDQVVSQYKRYIDHVAKYIGGITTEEKLAEEPGDIRTIVPKSKQQEALAFLKKHFFTTPKWLLKDDIFHKTKKDKLTVMQGIYNGTLGKLLDRRVLDNMCKAEIALGKSAYTIENYFNDLNNIVFAPMSADPEEAAYRRLMQKIYVQKLCDLYTGSGKAVVSNPVEKGNSDVSSMLLGQLEMLQNKFKAASANTTTLNGAHNRFLYERVRRAITDQRQK